jgi:hypothetical protein
MGCQKILADFLFFFGHPMQNAEVQKLQAKMREHEYERNIDEGKSEVAKLDKKIKDLRREKDTESADDFLFRSKSDELADKEASLAKMLYFLFPPPLLGVCVLTSLSSWSPTTTALFYTDI